jgi:hypothetical protein
MADDWKPEGARELPAEDWKPEGARPLEVGAPEAPLKFAKPGDIGAAGTLGAHTARHLSFGLGDKVMAGMAALDDLSHQEGNGAVGPLYGALKHALTPGDHTLSEAYKRNLAFNDQALEASDEEHPVARWVGNALGVAGSMAAPAGVLRLMRGAPAAAAAAPVVTKGLGQLAKEGAVSGLKNGTWMGALGGYGGSRSDDLAGTALDTGIGAGLGLAGGAGLGALAPVASRGLVRLGDKAKDAAGWLKVNSLKPNPTTAEAMEELPGGRVGLGRQLLEERIGGLTKHGTAEQLAKAAKEAGGNIEKVARAYDTGGGAPLDLTGAIDESLVHAAELNKDPLTKEAGNKLAGVAGEYRQIYQTPASAVEALALKRRIGDAAYKHTISPEPVAGQYGAGLSKLERGVNSSLESTLGPDFEQANLRSRRLYLAKDAAERTAARSHGNHLMGGLMSTVAGGAGFAHGGAHEALPLMLGSLALSKYGSQAGARALYSAGNALESGAVRSAAESPSGYTRALIEALRRRQEAAQMTPVAQPMFAQGDNHEP